MDSPITSPRTTNRAAAGDGEHEAQKPVDAIIESIHVRRDETGWTVLTVSRNGMPESWVGIMPTVHEGLKVRATGEWEDSERWGRRFKVHNLIVQLPEASDPDALARFLAKLVPGIGERIAWRIVDTFGAETVALLEAPDPTKIATVRGVSEAKAAELCEAWNRNSVEGRLLIQLARFSIRGAVAQRVLKRYGGRSVEVCEKEPYLLAIEVEGIGWKTADKIARANNIPLDDLTRIEAGILHTFDTEVAGAGHCYADEGKLLAAASKLLDLGMDKIPDGISALERRGRVVRESGRVYPTGLYLAEKRVAARVARLLVAPAILQRFRTDPMDPLGEVQPELPVPPAERMAEIAEEAIVAFERRTNSQLAPVQKEAVHAAMRHKMLVITGGPGCGKTFLTRAILSAWAAAGFDIGLAAPTGRAAKRLSEATGKPASTIHRFLAFDPKEGRFTRNANNPLEQTALCIDEGSMADLPLAASFLEAVDDGARLVLVGDVDQLPSVGPGAVLRDLIDSGVVPVVRLTQIFRQAEGSRIITNAHRVNRGLVPDRPQGESDFFWVERTTPEHALAITMKIVTDRLATKGISTRDAVVLTPQRRGGCGVRALNKALQAALNPSGPCLTLGKAPEQIVYRVGDRVMQLKNDYQREVFNGDTGWVTRVNPEKTEMVVEIPDADGRPREVVYERKHFEHVVHAYACTIHKYQGSQSKAVVVILLREHFMMLSRQILYTALTRAEKLCVLVGDPEAVRMAVDETRREVRSTTLRERLTEACANQ